LFLKLTKKLQISLELVFVAFSQKNLGVAVAFVRKAIS